ncbi:hypothetical protein [Cyanobium sp. ATX-6F1]|uniref:hypothetical protein n=1 Tax=Cyanobium sp. ATX-6F1 TaxID=3137388 RepID=UPI0039BECD1E
MVESSAPGNGESTPPTSPSTPSPTPATPEIESVEAADPGQPLAGTHGGTATAPEATTAEPTGEPPIEPEAESPGLQVSPEPVATGEPTFISSIEVPASPTAVGEGANGSC